MRACLGCDIRSTEASCFCCGGETVPFPMIYPARPHAYQENLTATEIGGHTIRFTPTDSLLDSPPVEAGVSLFRRWLASRAGDS